VHSFAVRQRTHEIEPAGWHGKAGPGRNNVPGDYLAELSHALTDFLCAVLQQSMALFECDLASTT
jgi:hypothetical protein